MPERPLILFAAPTIADKEKKHGGAPKFIKPTYDRQKARIAPKFAILQNAFEKGNVQITTIANAIEPEYTLVFETVGNPNGFYDAVQKLKTQYPNIEWVMELSNSCPNDNDFYVVDNNGNRDDQKQLSTKLFCILTNQEALSQILSLWNHFCADEQFKFQKGLAGFKQLFLTLKDVHQWGKQERIEDTGVLEDWNLQLIDDQTSTVKAQIELFYRTSEDKRKSSEERIVNLIVNCGGRVISRALIPEIQYHII